MLMIEIKTVKLHNSTFYSYSITVPKFWLKRNNLQKGDSIKLFLDETNNIVIKPCKNEQAE